MPATTRSANKQPKLEEVKGTETGNKSASETLKRKNTVVSGADNAKKKKGDNMKARPQKSESVNPQRSKGGQDPSEQELRDVILINRAPVLELWAICVTHFLYGSLPWDTCLSIGGAISTITAIAKGRSIGTMEKPDPGEAEQRRRERQEKAEKQQLDDIEVMGFHLMLKDGQAMVGEKPRKGDEAALKKKFGEHEYGMVKKAFEDALASWKGKDGQLDAEAFKMYEDFRPSVPPGQKGWGRKGQLSLENVKSVVGAG